MDIIDKRKRSFGFIIVLFSLIVILTGCARPHLREQDSSYKVNGRNIYIYTIDGCEYIGRLGSSEYADFLTHKGNCKQCSIKK